MTLERFIKRLGEGGLDFRAEDILDALWLAQGGVSLASSVVGRDDEGVTGGTRPGPGSGPAPGGGDTAPGEPDIDETNSADRPSEQARERTDSGDEDGMLYSGGALHAGDRTISASAVATPTARALPNRLELMRALRPLRQRWPSSHVKELDEDATVELTATLNEPGERAIYPVFRPRLERWFECDLILEDDDAVEIWRDPLRDFARTLRDSGAFREVRSWRLRLPPDATAADLARARLENPGGGRILAGRLSGGIRRLILFATHGASHHWRSGVYSRLLAGWSRDANVAVVHLLPRDMWLRTALGEAQGRCATSRPGAPSAGLDVEAYWWMPGPDPQGTDTLRLPVLELEPAAVEEWSSMLMARGRSAPLFLLDASPARTPPAPPAPDDDAMIARRIDQLREAAPDAFRLAVTLSLCPFTIPVAHLMQEAKFHAVDNRQLAELFLSGLIRSAGPAADLPGMSDTWYEIVGRAKPILMRSVRGEEAADLGKEIFERVSTHLATITGRAVTMASFTPDPDGKYQIPEWAQPFARMSNSLRAMRAEAPEPPTAIERLERQISPKSFRLLARMAAPDVPGSIYRQSRLIREIGQADWQVIKASGILRPNDASIKFEESAYKLLERRESLWPLHGFRILWVDDIPDNNSEIRAEFEKWGAAVVERLDTESGLAELGNNYDLAISDMGRGTEQRAGFDFLARVREMGSRVPVIIFAGGFARSAERRAEALRAGAIGCTFVVGDLIAMALAVARAESLPADNPADDGDAVDDDDLEDLDGPDDAPAQAETAGDHQRLGEEAMSRGEVDIAEQSFHRQLEMATATGRKDQIHSAQRSLGGVFQARAQYVGAEDWYRQGLATAEEMGTERLIADSCADLGFVALNVGKLDEAMHWFRRELTLAEDVTDEDRIQVALLHVAEVASTRGDLEEAETHYRRVIDLGSGWGRNSAVATLLLARIARQKGDLEGARQLCLVLVERSKPLGDIEHLSPAYFELGAIYEDLKDFDTAEQWYRRLIDDARSLGRHAFVVQGLLQIGRLAEKKPDLERAGEAYRSALNLAEQSGDGAQHAACLAALAALEVRTGQSERAWDHYVKAAHIYRDIGHQRAEGATWLEIGRIEGLRLEWSSAATSYGRTLSIGRESGDEDLIASAAYGLGGVEVAQDKLSAAESHYREAAALRARWGDRLRASECYQQLGGVMVQQGDLQSAVQMYRSALEYRLELGDAKIAEELQHEIDELTTRGELSGTSSTSPSPVMKLGQVGIDLIKSFETISAPREDGLYQAYRYPTGESWEIGWGTTGPDVTQDSVWNREQCDRRFEQDLQAFAGKVAALVGGPTSQHQFDALVSFAYDVGIVNFEISKLLDRHNAGNHEGATREFAVWDKAAGKAITGLARRRAEEARLYAGKTSPS